MPIRSSDRPSHFFLFSSPWIDTGICKMMRPKDKRISDVTACTRVEGEDNKEKERSFVMALPVLLVPFVVTVAVVVMLTVGSFGFPRHLQKQSNKYPEHSIRRHLSSQALDLVPQAAPNVLPEKGMNSMTAFSHVKDNRDGDPSYDLGGLLPRVYRKWPPDRPLPCFDPHEPDPNDNLHKYKIAHKMGAEGKPLDEGFMYMKPAKCASSTAAGIQLRIGRNRAMNESFAMCDLRWSHGLEDGEPLARRFRHRNRDKSYLWTLLRDPTARHLSMFFYDTGVALKVPQQPPQNVLEQMFFDYFQDRPSDRDVDSRSSQYYLRDLNLNGDFDALEKSDAELQEIANRILLDYDFIGVVERFDESIVALKMLLDLPLADVLYLKSKTNGHYALGRCFFESFLTPEMQKRYDSSEWQEWIKFDVYLLRAANASLDMTIQMLGKAQFEETLQQFQSAQKRVAEQCADAGRAQLTCKEAAERKVPPSTYNDCLGNRDIACAMTCLDQVATDLDLW